MLLAMMALSLSANAHEVTIEGVALGAHSVKKLLFDGEQVTIIFDDDQTLTGFTDMVIDFTDPTGINQLHYYDAAKVAIDGGTLNVSGLNPSKPISIFSATGQAVKKIAAPQTESVSIDISNLVAGVYLLNSGNNTIRFVKK